MKTLGIVAAALALATVASAQTFTVLHSFDYIGVVNGPESGVVLSGDTLYGATGGLGMGGNGTVFKVSTNGTGFAILHISTNADWNHPNGLVLSDDTLYGTTQYGHPSGSAWNGTVFKMNTDGSNYTVLKFFTNTDGQIPQAGLVLSGDTLYGTTSGGGDWNNGTVFKVDTNGVDFAVLHSFTANDGNSDGAFPVAALTLVGDTLFGTAHGGGSNGVGTVFRLSKDGSGFTVLHAFSAVSSTTNDEGAWPVGSLMVSGDTIYGTTSGGGSGCGTVFRMNTNGSGYTVLHGFRCMYDGPDMGPRAGVTLSGNTLYGTTANDVNPNLGTIFKISTDGSDYAVFHSFSLTAYCPPSSCYTNWDGGISSACLIRNGGVMYGTATIDGAGGGGTVFSLQVPVAAIPPVLTSLIQSNGTLAFSWSAEPGSSYQVQYSTDAASGNWSNLGGVLVATNDLLSVSDAIGPDRQRFYRVVLVLP